MDWFASPYGGTRWRGLRPLLEKTPPDKRDDVIAEFCKTYPTWFFEMYTEIQPGQPLLLEEYQIAYLLDTNRFTATNKTRQAGGSLVVSMKKFWDGYTNENRDCDIVSLTRAEGQGKIRYIRNLWESLPLRWRHPLAIDNAEKIAFHKGRRMSVIRAIAASAGVRGGEKSIVFDEAAHIPNFEALFTAALPATIRGNGGFDVISTPLGQQGKFFEIWSNPIGKRGKRMYDDWSRHEFCWWDVTVFCIDVHAARKRWIEDYDQNPTLLKDLYEEFANDDLRLIVESMTDEEYEQEFCGVFVDETEAFFPYSVIEPCRKPVEPVPSIDGVLEPWDRRPDDNDNAVYIGIDFAEGKKGGDSTSVQVVEVLPDRRYMHRYHKDMGFKEGYENFDVQMREIDEIIARFRPGQVRVDATGLGVKIASDLRNRHGGLIDPITFTNQNKAEMALNLKGMMERENLWIQRENERLRGQIHNIKRTITASGNIQYEGKPHDDMFWALALACKDGNRNRFRIITFDGEV